MNRFFKIALLCLAVVATASAAMAQDEKSSTTPAAGTADADAASASPVSKSTAVYLGGAFGAGLVIFGRWFWHRQDQPRHRREHGSPTRGGRQHSDRHDHCGGPDRRCHVLRANRLHVVQQVVSFVSSSRERGSP